MSRELVFGGVSHCPSIRTLDDMRDVVYDKAWLKTAEDRALYFMYRDLASSAVDRRKLHNQHLRYDITIIPAGTLGAEFIKTAGHIHPPAEEGLSYTEIYEVLGGQAHFLLQEADGGKVSDAVFMKANRGDVVVIPPNYGHVTINPGKVPLKMANLVSDRFESDYRPYRKRGGAAYFELSSGELIANEVYGRLPPLRTLAAQDLSTYGLRRGRSIYSLINEPSVTGFLNKPSAYLKLFKAALL